MNDKLNQIVCIDFETGGFTADKNPITEVAVLSFRMDTLEEISRFSSYVKGYNNLVHEPKALEFTGITMAMINSGLSLREMVDALCEQFTKANTGRTHTKKPTLLGHNVKFDINFLQYAFRLAKVDLGKYIDGDTDIYGNFQPSRVDTMWLSRQRWAHDPTMANFKLETCCIKGDINLVDAHGAMNDVVATKELYCKLTTNMRSGGSSLIEENGSKESRFRDQFEM